MLATFERRDQRHVAVIKLGLQELKDPGLESTKAWLPIETQVIGRDIALQLGQKDLKGFYITRVYPDLSSSRASEGLIRKRLENEMNLQILLVAYRLYA